MKDATKSSEEYQKAIKISPQYADAWFNLGLVYAETKSFTECEKCFQRVISIAPNYTYAYYALGMTYEKLGNNENAILNYEKFLSLNKDTKSSQVIEAKIKSLKGTND